jgi:ADP-dependent NAD(P)H-hydrate dehydratase
MDQTPLTAQEVAKMVPPRRKDAHKRMNGTVCVVGGSRLYHGAPFHCAMGALRSGVDLVFAAVPAVVAPSIRALSPELIVVPLPDSKLTRGNVSKLLAWVEGVDTYAIGPGLGAQDPALLAQALNRLVGTVGGIVVDADALRPQSLPPLAGRKAIVTPHAGEFERLFGMKLPEPASERAAVAQECAASSKLTVLLKGPTDVITDGSRVALNDTHSPGMTVGGTGDVLAGVAAGLMARGAGPFEAACAAAYVNGAAGEAVEKAKGFHMTAGDVVDEIPAAMKRFDRLT